MNQYIVLFLEDFVKDKIVFSIIILFALLSSHSLFAQNNLNLLIRNSSGVKLEVQLIKKSDNRNVFIDTIPNSRIVKVTGLEKGAYILQYKYLGRKSWRVMNVLLIRSNKVYVLF